LVVVADKQYVPAILKEKEANISLNKIFEMLLFIESEGVPLDNKEMKYIIDFLKKNALFNATHTHQLLKDILGREVKKMGNSGKFEAFHLAKKVVTYTSAKGFFELELHDDFFEGIFEYERRITQVANMSFVLPTFIGRRVLPPRVHAVRDELIDKYLMPAIDKELNVDDEDANTNPFFKFMVQSASRENHKVDKVMLARSIIVIMFASLSNTANAIGQMIACMLEGKTEYLDRVKEEVAEKGWDYEHWVTEHDSFLNWCAWEVSRYTIHRFGSVRIVQQPYKIGEYVLPPDSLVIVPSTILSYDDKVFANPFEFDPTRFDVERNEQRNKLNLIAWGLGVHKCPGQQFAIAEMKMVLACLLHNFDLKPEKFPEINDRCMTTICGRLGDCILNYKTKSAPRQNRFLSNSQNIL